MLRKFLILGLGGSGGKTIRYIKQALEEWFRQVGWRGGMPDGWQFLHIDTPAAQDSPTIPGRPELLKPEEYLSLYQPGIEFETIVTILKDRKHDLRGWEVDPALMHIPIDLGAGQYRAVGRMLGLYQIEEIKVRVKRKGAALMTPGAAAQLVELTETIEGHGIGGGQDPTPIVMVISSLAGGTGAGIIVDVCDVLRSGGERWMDDSVGILYSADVFSELSQAASEGVQPNSAAAFSEILHGYFGGGGFTAPGGGPVQQRSGPAFPYLVGHSNTKGVQFGDQLEVYRVMGRCLAAVMSDPSIQDNFTSYLMANWTSSAGKFPEADEGIGLLAEPPSYGGAFQALGFAEVELGGQRLEMYAERRITRDAVEWALEGHRTLIDDRPNRQMLSEEERIELLANEAFTRFLNNCQINERGRETNQILDALHLSKKQLDADLTGMREEIWSTCRDYLGEKAKSQEWIDTIVEEVEVRRNGILEKWEFDLRHSMAEWTRESENRIVEEVGKFIAERGIPVTVALLRKAEAEMKDVSAELREESHEEEQLCSHLVSDVESILPAGGTLRADNPDIRRAIGQALDTGVVRRYQSKLRLLTADLVGDFREDLLARLRDALGEARDTLHNDIEDAENLIGSSVSEWPRHSPPSDQNVPESLIPGQNVKTLLDPQDFKSLFKDLTAKSLGRGVNGEKGAQRRVREQALLGQSNQSPPLCWIEQTDHWHPRDSLTLGDDPKNPASFHIALRRDDILARANEWLHREGSEWNDFLSQGLREYLSDSSKLRVAERVRRERRFRRQLEAAFEAAEPLASVDQTLMAMVHPATELKVRPVPGEIPVAGLPVEEQIAEFLTARFEGDPEKAMSHLTQSEHLTKIPIYSSLSSAFHPIVFDSLMRPIAEDFNRAETLSTVPDFWKWRRARTLNVAAPIPAPTLLAMLRGWFTANLLGALEIGSRATRLHSPDGVLEFPRLLRGGSVRSHEALAELVEGLAVAIPMAATSKRFEKYLGAYRLLVEWGREPGTASSTLSRYQVPSRVLSKWLETGESMPGCQAKVKGSDQMARAEQSERMLGQALDFYLREQKLEEERHSRHPWLGLAEPIKEALNQLKDCVVHHTSEGPLL